ncbi:MAG: DUF5060 domain-containing protein [Verrucomicrobiota bacterium]
MRPLTTFFGVLCLSATLILNGLGDPPPSDAVTIGGEMKEWHKITLTFNGRYAAETDTNPNPFTDLEMNVQFTHESGAPSYTVPAYFAADGNAGETSATAGNQWRAHLSPDKTGKWNYVVDFKHTDLNGVTGSFEIAASDKTGRDLRAKGRLQYTGTRYLQFAGNGEYFLKAGADSPETFLAYADFDGTVTDGTPLKTWAPHVPDWQNGDPTWQSGKGKGMIGAINYLAAKGANVFSFIPYNAGGDGDNVWPHISRDKKLHFDCSKLDQWGVVFDHAAAQGMFLHFKLQETENDDLNGKKEAGKRHALDGGKLGPQRKAYLREMVARFGYHLALNWNLGEENTQSLEQISAMAHYLREIDPYGHPVVLHTYPNEYEKRYTPHLGNPKTLTGVSIQNSDVVDSHKNVLEWITRSESSGHQWIVSMDEAGNAGAGSPPDPDWPGVAEAIQKNAKAKKPIAIPNIDEVRSYVLWGTLLAGGTGTEYYFGYKLPENDLNAENWRSRDQTWEYSNIALRFFREHQIPFWEMDNANALIGTNKKQNNKFCFAKANELYLVYLTRGGSTDINLQSAAGDFTVQWFNPRQGGPLKSGSVSKVTGGARVSLGNAPATPEQDWLILVRKK